MRTLRSLLWDARRGIVPVVAFVSAIMICMLLAGGIVGAAWLFGGRGKPPTDLSDARIPFETYAVAMIEVVDCIDRGPQYCSDYDKSREYLARTTGSKGIVYTPLSPSDPGVNESGGLKRLVLSENTSASEWQRFARAITRGGKVTPAAVNAAGVTMGDGEDDYTRLASFTIPSATSDEPAQQGTLTLRLSESLITMSKVIYTEGSD